MSTRTDVTPPPHAGQRPAIDRAGPVQELGLDEPERPSWLRDDLNQLARFWPVVQNMVVQELRVRYQRSILGFFWTLLNPILMMATLTVVFSQLMGRDWRTFAVYLFAGMVPWGLFAGTINECAFCIIANEGLIRKIYLPKLVFPLVRLLINLVTFALSLVAMYILLAPLGARPSWPLATLPLAVLLLAAFALGLGLLIAVANTFFRDCSHLVGVVLQAWYFATPIIYPIDQFRPEMQWRFWLNPAYPFIRLFHVVIFEGQWPGAGLVLLASAIAAVVLGAGYAAFKLYEDKLIFRL